MGDFPLLLPLTALQCLQYVLSHVFYKLRGKKEGKNPNSKRAAKARVNRNHSIGTTAPSRKPFPALFALSGILVDNYTVYSDFRDGAVVPFE
jgi:hypothetical protein